MGRLSNSKRCFPNLGVFALCCLILTKMVAAQAPSSDVVTIFNNLTKKQQTYRGLIVDYDHNELKLQLVSGREQIVPSAQITDISSLWNSEYVAAEGYLFERRFERALISYRQAYMKETRAWVKHRITAKMIQCEQNMGNWHKAADQFFDVLLSQQNNSPYLTAAPIVWHPLTSSGELLHRGRELMKAENPLKQLVGASWLFSSPYNNDAITLFKQLEQHSDQSIALLASAQLWRSKTPLAKAADVKYWDQAILQLPKELRAGPLHVVAQMKRRLDMHEEAVLTWMRIPILYPAQHHLASEAIYASVRELINMVQYDEALILCQELEANYSDTTAGTQVTRLKSDIHSRIKARNAIKKEGDSS
ncbi:MAG: hypothetical protein VX776_06895 [Planctomycetota bacterium]|nr:hypothetical protein [Planctomycetota bacterium]